MLINIQIQALKLPLKTTFKQASFTRNVGESIWCEASRGNKKGYGEGCPRHYVTNETVPGGLKWLKTQFPSIQNNCTCLTTLKTWIAQNKGTIDKNPAAFCAIETALLDLFAKEENQSVETLLNLDAPQKNYAYTAILGDSSISEFSALLRRYITIGFTDFKVKLNGNLVLDKLKLETIHQYCQNKNIAKFRIRLDANNLWSDQAIVKVIEYLKKLPNPIFGIEEPIKPKQFATLVTISKAINLPIILDESLCNLTDFASISDLNGQFIANLKVSKVGGLIRTIELVQHLQKKQIPIIIGAHVGETSILTRAGMAAVNAVGPTLVAQEGGFGVLLLKKDQVQPSLNFGAKGFINLGQPYKMKTKKELITIPKENWNYGWGLRITSNN